MTISNPWGLDTDVYECFFTKINDSNLRSRSQTPIFDIDRSKKFESVFDTHILSGGVKPQENPMDIPVPSNDKKTQSINHQLDKHVFTACAVCQVPTTQKCGRCGKVFFCKIECQRKGWPSHRESCLPAKQKTEVKDSPQASKDTFEILSTFREHTKGYGVLTEISCTIIKDNQKEKVTHLFFNDLDVNHRGIKNVVDAYKQGKTRKSQQLAKVFENKVNSCFEKAFKKVIGSLNNSKMSFDQLIVKLRGSKPTEIIDFDFCKPDGDGFKYIKRTHELI